MNGKEGLRYRLFVGYDNPTDNIKGNILSDCYIVGIGMVPFGRHLDRTIVDLTREAVQEAMADAGIEHKDVGAAYFANATQGLLGDVYYVRGQIALRQIGFPGLQVINVENACAGGTTALHGACMHIAAGEADIVLAVGVEKMFCQDKAKSFGLFSSAWDIQTTKDTLAAVTPFLDKLNAPAMEVGKTGGSIIMESYSARARLHMALFGTTQRELAEVSAKNHRHSVNNPKAQYRRAMTADEVLAGRTLAWPLTVPMCAPISDGAAAAIVCSKKALARLGASCAIRVLAAVSIGGTDRAPDDMANQASALAAKKAYERAGIGPKDISVTEVHDASAFGEVVQTEAIGLFEFGDGGKAAARGDTSLGGCTPVNVSGGLECRGHPLSATGLAQMYELVMQLRGEAGPRQVQDARIAMAQNSGGIYGIEAASNCITILGS